MGAIRPIPAAKRNKLARATVKRTYKDSVFTGFLKEPARLLEIYNAVSGKSYEPGTEIEIVTLENVLYRQRQNDIAFVLDGRFIVLAEHQSSPSPNLPLRFLEYIGREYESITDSRSHFYPKRMMIPMPEFIVFYNGTANQPEREILRLSDAFLASETEAGIQGSSLELTVPVYNINFGHNGELLAKSRSLYEYSAFIAKVREFYGEMPLADADAKAIYYCKKHGIMEAFLERHGAEVLNMLTTQYTFEEEMDFNVREAEKRGIAIGESRGEERVLDAMKKAGIPEDLIAAVENTLEHEE